MATKTAYLNTRVERALKAEADEVFTAIGLSPSAAITMFLRQVVMRRGLPFDACIPNAETVEALKEIEAGGGEVVHSSTAEAFREILSGGKHRTNEAAPNRRSIQKRPAAHAEPRPQHRQAR